MGRRLGLRTFQTEGTPCSEAGMWTKQGKTDHRKKVHVAGAMESSGRGMLWWRGLAIPFQEVSGPQPGGQRRHGRGSSGLRRD